MTYPRYQRTAPHVDNGVYLYQIPTGEWVPVEVENMRMYLLKRISAGSDGLPMVDCLGALKGPLLQPDEPLTYGQRMMSPTVLATLDTLCAGAISAAVEKMSREAEASIERERTKAFGIDPDASPHVIGSTWPVAPRVDDGKVA